MLLNYSLLFTLIPPNPPAFFPLPYLSSLPLQQTSFSVFALVEPSPSFPSSPPLFLSFFFLFFFFFFYFFSFFFSCEMLCLYLCLGYGTGDQSDWHNSNRSWVSDHFKFSAGDCIQSMFHTLQIALPLTLKKGINVFGWPQIVISIYGPDFLGRDVVRGYPLPRQIATSS